jgi:hypothetical protein
MAEAIGPGKVPLDHPALSTQSRARLDTAPGDAWDDASQTTGSSTAGMRHRPCLRAVSACRFCGRRRGRPQPPRGWRMGGIGQSPRAASRGRWLSRAASRAGCRCGRRRGDACSRACRGGADSARSPRPLWLAHSPNQARRTTSQSCPHQRVAATIRDGIAPTCPPGSSRAAVASTSCRCHNPSHGARAPVQCRS